MSDHDDRYEAEARDATAEAAGLILAQAEGDNDLIDALLHSMWQNRDTPGAITTLRAVIAVAGSAIEGDYRWAVSQGADTTPAIQRVIGYAQVSREAEGR